MVEGRSSFLWDHTASLMAHLANINRNPKKQREFQVSDYHPHVDKVPRKKKQGVDRDRWIAAVLNNGHRRR